MTSPTSSVCGMLWDHEYLWDHVENHELLPTCRRTDATTDPLHGQHLQKEEAEHVQRFVLAVNTLVFWGVVSRLNFKSSANKLCHLSWSFSLFPMFFSVHAHEDDYLMLQPGLRFFFFYCCINI